jgi:hypothetical protein
MIDELKGSLLEMGICQVLIPLTNSPSSEVQGNSAAALGNLSSKDGRTSMDDYAAFNDVWDKPDGGMHKYLYRFLMSPDATFQHIAVWTIVQLLESGGRPSPSLGDHLRLTSRQTHCSTRTSATRRSSCLLFDSWARQGAAHHRRLSATARCTPAAHARAIRIRIRRRRARARFSCLRGGSLSLRMRTSTATRPARRPCALARPPRLRTAARASTTSYERAYGMRSLTAHTDPDTEHWCSAPSLAFAFGFPLRTPYVFATRPVADSLVHICLRVSLFASSGFSQCTYMFVSVTNAIPAYPLHCATQ